jgi:hypothetical protein
MPDTLRCPDCGRDNPAGAESCEHCGFPLREAAPVPSAPSTPAGPPPEAPPPPAAPPSAAASSGPAVDRSLMRPFRPRRPRPQGSTIALQLWLVFGTFCALVVIGIAFQANIERARQPVEGSSAAQQQEAGQLQERLEKDSTDVEARVRLGDIYYDTGNWPDAIVQYRAAARMDSTLSNVLVDLGVAYYNLGSGAEAERHFLLALKRDPHHPVALFNLGIVNEARNEPKAALEFYHRALQSNPPDKMREPLLEAMGRVQAKLGSTAPPLPDGR